MMFILSIGSAAVFYSAWYLNLPVLSLDWVLYSIAWIPLLMLLVSAYKYDQKDKTSRSSTKVVTTQKLNSRMQ